MIQSNLKIFGVDAQTFLEIVVVVAAAAAAAAAAAVAAVAEAIAVVAAAAAAECPAVAAVAPVERFVVVSDPWIFDAAEMKSVVGARRLVAASAVVEGDRKEKVVHPLMAAFASATAAGAERE